jgi:hypothetical protein
MCGGTKDGGSFVVDSEGRAGGSFLYEMSLLYTERELLTWDKPGDGWKERREGEESIELKRDLPARLVFAVECDSRLCKDATRSGGRGLRML